MRIYNCRTIHYLLQRLFFNLRNIFYMPFLPGFKTIWMIQWHTSYVNFRKYHYLSEKDIFSTFVFIFIFILWSLLWCSVKGATLMLYYKNIDLVDLPEWRWFANTLSVAAIPITGMHTCRWWGLRWLVALHLVCLEKEPITRPLLTQVSTQLNYHQTLEAL